MELPETIAIEYKGNILDIPVSFDTSSFVENQIGKQTLYATVTDNTLLEEYNIEINSIYIEINVLPYTFSLNKNTNEYTLTGYYGSDSVLNVLDEYAGKKVTVIASNAFMDNNIIEEIYISNTFKKIEFNAFNNCGEIERITLPFIGESKDSSNNCFGYIFSASNSNSHYSYVPKSIKYVEILEGITNIGNGAFYYCDSIEEIKLPNSVKTIGNYVFQLCSSLETVNLNDNIESIGECTFMNCDKLKNVTIPSKITIIHRSMFDNCLNMEYINIPVGVTKIETNAFYECLGLHQITIPSSVTSIESSAFSSCYNLMEVYNESDLVLTPGSYDNGEVAYNALKVVNKGVASYKNNATVYEYFTTEDGFKFLNFNNEYYLISYTGTDEVPTLLALVNSKTYKCQYMDSH